MEGQELSSTVLISEWANPAAKPFLPASTSISTSISVLRATPLCSSTARLHGASGSRATRTAISTSRAGVRFKEFSENYTKAYNATKNIGYIAVPSANHDYQRPNIGTRNTPDQLKVAMTFFLTMPGIPFIYYGDEIGMKYQMNLPNKEGSNERSVPVSRMQWTKGKNAPVLYQCA